MGIYNSAINYPELPESDEKSNENSEGLDCYVKTILYNVRTDLYELSESQKVKIRSELAECYEYYYLEFLPIIKNVPPMGEILTDYEINYFEKNTLESIIDQKTNTLINDLIFEYYLKDNFELDEKGNLTYKVNLFKFDDSYSIEKKLGYLLFATFYEYWLIVYRFTIASTLSVNNEDEKYKNELSIIKNLYKNIPVEYKDHLLKSITINKGAKKADNLLWIFNCNVPDDELIKICKIYNISKNSDIYKGYREPLLKNYNHKIIELFENNIKYILTNLKIDRFELIGTGDGSGTKGILGYTRMGCRLFSYDFNKYSKIQSRKSITFKDGIVFQTLFLILNGSNGSEGYVNNFSIEIENKEYKFKNNSDNNIIKYIGDKNTSFNYSESPGILTPKPYLNNQKINSISQESGFVENDRYDEIFSCFFISKEDYNINLKINADNLFKTNKFYLEKNILSDSDLNKIKNIIKLYNIKKYEFELYGFYIGNYKGENFPKVIRFCDDIAIEKISTCADSKKEDITNNDDKLRYSSIRTEIEKNDLDASLKFIIESFVSPAPASLNDDKDNTLKSLRTYRDYDIKIENPVLSGLRSFGTAKKILQQIDLEDSEIDNTLSNVISKVRCKYYEKDNATKKDILKFFAKNIKYEDYKKLLLKNQ